jgi:hypothetical protein
MTKASLTSATVMDSDSFSTESDIDTDENPDDTFGKDVLADADDEKVNSDIRNQI